MVSQLLTLFAPIISDVVTKIIPDADKSKEVEKEVKLALLEHTDSLESLRGQIVLAEAKSQNFLTASWRPLLMLIAIAIIAVNYLVFPIVGIFYPEIAEHTLVLPDQLWNLLTLGVGGYIVGRSGEKMVDKWKG